MNDESNESNEANVTSEAEKASEAVSSPGIKRKPKFSALLLVILVVALAVPGAYLVYNSLAATKQVPGNTATCGTTKNTCKVGKPKNYVDTEILTYTWQCQGTMNPSTNIRNCSTPKIEVYGANQGATTANPIGTALAWKLDTTNCNSPQCESDPSYYNIIRLTSSNNISFDKYPARNACKPLDLTTGRIGWRLPTHPELVALINDRTTYNIDWIHQNETRKSATYWSADEYSSIMTNAWAQTVELNSNYQRGDLLKTNPQYVRCVRSL